jgi:hypothetical protein
MNRHLLWSNVILSLIAIALLLPARHPQSASANADVPSVTFPFFIADHDGDPVRSITVANLTILDDGKPPSQFGISLAKGPLRLALIIDDSGSENFSELYPAAVKAAGYFLRRALTADNDRAMVVVFTDQPKATELMDRNQIGQFSVHLARHGSSALYDAIVSACNGMYYDVTGSPRRVLVIVGQGDDNSSRATLEDAISKVQHLRGVMFFVETAPNRSEASSEKHERKKFEDAVKSAGGFVYGSLQPSDLSKTFADIQQLIGAEMVATYLPAQNKARKRRHSIELKLVDPSLGWRIYAPRTYEEQ